MFYNNNKSSMLEKCNLIAGEIAQLDVLTNKTVTEAVLGFENLNTGRLIITDSNSIAIYDSNDTLSTVGKYVLFTEIVSALSGNDIFVGKYHNGTMRSSASVPVYAYGTLIGSVYLAEQDTSQGALIASLQKNVFTITAFLEILIILCSLIFSTTYSARLHTIMRSIRNVREGDYSHSLDLSGHDELNVLGDEFNDLISRLQVSENKRNRFVSDASHELKTPLASIKLLSDSILQNSMDLETVNEFVADIGNEADRLNRMSQKLLMLSRTDEPAANAFEIIKISPTLDRVIRMLSVLAEKNKVKIVQHIHADSTVLVVEDDLYQIIFNLVENGIKYNSVGGTLTVTLFEDQENMVLKIQDTGVGIPEESLTHIFERFYRVDKARSRSSGGSGLGLSIVRSMVERNNGTIQVESSVGMGTTFTLTVAVFDITENEE